MSISKTSSPEARSPEDFPTGIRLYLAGVPIERKFESPARWEEFRNLILRAKRDGWGVLADCGPGYYRGMAPDGFGLLHEMQARITYADGLWFENGHRVTPRRLAQRVSGLIQHASCPTILLRPGSPRVFDATVPFLLEEYGERAEILEAKSSLDILADKVEMMTGRPLPRRRLFSGPEIIEVTDPQAIRETDVLLIGCLHPLYYDGWHLPAILLHLLRMNQAQARLFICSPALKPTETNVSELLAIIGSLPQEDHYSVGILPDSI